MISLPRPRLVPSECCCSSQKSRQGISLHLLLPHHHHHSSHLSEEGARSVEVPELGIGAGLLCRVAMAPEQEDSKMRTIRRQGLPRNRGGLAVAPDHEENKTKTMTRNGLSDVSYSQENQRLVVAGENKTKMMTRNGLSDVSYAQDSQRLMTKNGLSDASFSQESQRLVVAQVASVLLGRDDDDRHHDATGRAWRLVFVYGTLKRGFGNHWLMEELLAKGHASFVGGARTKMCFPLVCGPFQVPFLLHAPSSGHQVLGEVYCVDEVAMERLDELEGVSKGHYERHPLVIQLTFSDCTDLMLAPTTYDGVECNSLFAESYFAAAPYSHLMADCAPHIPCYTEKEAKTYIRRKDRPQNRSFLEHVYAWIDHQGTMCTV